MKRILQRGKHLWKAKGRHGTHSPFVYAFVEQVMRAKIQFAKEQSSEKKLTKRQINLIGRTIQYLKPSVVYVEQALMESLKALSENDGLPEFRELPPEITAQEVCIICLPASTHIDLLKKIATERICTVIIPLNIANEEGRTNWALLKEMPDFKMVLNAWSIGLCSNHPDFKTKQYFRLR